MRFTFTRFAAVILAVVSVGIGGIVAQAATAAPVAPRSVVLSTTERGTCVKIGTGEYRDLWLDANTHRCPIYSPTEAYWGPKTFGGAPGPAGPKGDKGEPGANALVFGHAEHTFGDNATVTLTITGQPKFSALIGKRTLVTTDHNATAPVVVTITPINPAVGDTERKFTVKVEGMVAETKDVMVTIDTLTAVAPSAN